MPYFGGLDWGAAGHAVCVVDGAGAVVLRLAVTHDAAGLDELCKRLAKLAPTGAIPIAIERPSGLIVDVLLDAGHPVVPIYPNAVKACRPRYRAAGGKSDPGDAYMLAFIQRYPTPDSAARLGEKRIQAFLASHSYGGRKTPAELLQRLRDAPTGMVGDAEAEASGDLLRALAAILERLIAEIAKLTARIEHAVAELPDGRIVMSFPRAGRICAAQILAELGDVRQRFLCADQLAAEAGVCPVTHASGKSRGVVFRWACNHRLRAAITCFADNSRHASNWAADVYKRARTRGCSHPHPRKSMDTHPLERLGQKYHVQSRGA